MPNDPWRDARRIVVMRLDNIGDVIMLSPMLRALRKHLPNARITLMASKAGALAAPLLPWVDEVMQFRALWQDLQGDMSFDPVRELAAAESLRSKAFDVAVICTSFSQTVYAPGYLCYLAGIPVRIGQSRDFGGGVLSHWIKPPADATHQAERNLNLLEQTGCPLDGRHLEIRAPERDAETAARLLREQGVDPSAPFIVVAPGASCPSRRYPRHHFESVIRLLARRTVLPVVVLGREGEDIAPALPASNPQVVSLVGRTSVPEFSAVIGRASLVIANNSAAMHMADAQGVPMVLLYSGTDEESEWRPRKARSILLRRRTHCAPCRLFECPYSMECLNIPPGEVVQEALKSLMKRCAATGPRFCGT